MWSLHVIFIFTVCACGASFVVVWSLHLWLLQASRQPPRCTLFSYILLHASFQWWWSRETDVRGGGGRVIAWRVNNIIMQWRMSTCGCGPFHGTSGAVASWGSCLHACRDCLTCRLCLGVWWVGGLIECLECRQTRRHVFHTPQPNIIIR